MDKFDDINIDDFAAAGKGFEEPKAEIETKNDVIDFVEKQSKSVRTQDNIRFNPIVKEALLYWKNDYPEFKSKGDIIEKYILPEIPEEHLLRAYNKIYNHNKT